MINFGSIFLYRENHYVYLAQDDDQIYVAKILNKDETRNLIRYRELKSRNPNNHTGEQPLYCFVILSTEEFKDCSAHYGNPSKDSSISIEYYSQLNEEDISQLKKEISDDPIISDKIKELIQ